MARNPFIVESAFGALRTYASPAAYLAATGHTPRKSDFFYDDTDEKYKYFDGSSWQDMTSSGWLLAGNAGTNHSINFIGTTDTVPFVIRTNNTQRIYVESTGEVFVGDGSGSSPSGTLSKFARIDNTYRTMLRISNQGTQGAGYAIEDSIGDAEFYRNSLGTFLRGGDDVSLVLHQEDINYPMILRIAGIDAAWVNSSVFTLQNIDTVQRVDDSAADAATASALFLMAGSKTHAGSTGNGGSLSITAGSAFGTAGGAGGNLILAGGSSVFGLPGATQINSRMQLRTEFTASTSSTIPANTIYYAVQATGSPKTVDLNPISESGKGAYIIIKDEGGDADTNPITINAVGGDLFDNGTAVDTISDAFGFVCYIAGESDVWRKICLSGGGVSIGDAVSGGSPHHILFVDAGGLLAQSADLQYNDSTNVMTLAGNLSMSGGVGTRHIVWDTDAGGNIGVDTRTGNDLGDGLRPKHIFVRRAIAVGNLFGLSAPYGLNNNNFTGVVQAGDLVNTSAAISTATLFTGGSIAALSFPKTGDYNNVPAFANFDVALDYDIYFCRLHTVSARIDLLKFGGDGTLTMMQSSDADILWDTAGGGSVGLLAGNQPLGVHALSTMSIGGTKFHVTQATVNTTDAIPTTLQTIATTTDSAMMVEFRVTALRTGGTAGTANDGASFIATWRIKNDGGTVTAYPMLSDESKDQSWSINLSIAGTDVLLDVTGATDNDITWDVTTITQET